MLDTESPEAPVTSDALVDQLLALDVSGDPSPTDTPADAPADAGTDPAPEAQVPEVPADAPAPAPVASEPPADTAASPDAPTDATPAPESPVIAPFHVTVDGTKVDVPGATVVGDTITMPREAFARVIQPRLADRTVWQRREQDYKAQLTQAKAERSTETEQSKVVLEKLSAILAEPDEVKRWDAMEDMRAKMPLLLKDAEIAALKRQTSQTETKELDEVRTRAKADLEAAIPANVADHLDVLLAKPEYGALLGDRQRVLDFLLDNTDKLYLANGEPDPTTGIPPLAFNYDYVTRHLGREAKYAADRAKQYETVKAAAAANAASQRRTPPPAAPATGTPTGAVKGQPIASKADFERMLDQLASGEV